MYGNEISIFTQRCMKGTLRQRPCPWLFRTIIIIVIASALSKALSHIFELIYEDNMLLGKEVAKVSVANINRHLLQATCVHREILNCHQLESPSCRLSATMLM